MKAIITVLVFVGLSAALSAQSTLMTPSASHPTIQAAINAAANGDIVVVLPGHYFESLVILDKGITLRGAGSGTGTTTTIDGFGIQRCLTVINTNQQSVSFQVVVEDINFTGGSAPSNDPHGHDECGGAVLADVGEASLLFQRCEFSFCAATCGGAVYDAGSSAPVNPNPVDFIDCAFRDNHWLTASSGGLAREGGALWTAGLSMLRGCSFERNGSSIAAGQAATGEGGAVHFGAGMTVPLRTITDCLFRENSADLGAAVSVRDLASPNVVAFLQIANSTFLDNRGGAGSGALSVRQGGAVGIDLCLFSGNDSVAGAKVLDLETLYCLVARTTMAGNAPGNVLAESLRVALPSVQVPTSPTSPALNIESSVIAGNGNEAWTIERLGGIGQGPVIEYSLLGAIPTSIDTLGGGLPFPVSTAAFVTTFVGLDPAFVDAPNGDFHLRRRSPGVDIGAAPLPFPIPPVGLDLDGLPLRVGDGPDAGCFEHQHPEAGPDYEGTVPDGLGSPVDVLSLNGAVGGVARKLYIPTSSAYVIDLQPAPGDLFADLVIFGRLGAPEPSEAFSIPFAGGSMAFVPAAVAPTVPSLFTAFDSTGIQPALVATGPAPMNFAGIASSSPEIVTLQGLITIGSGAVRLTNAIVIHAY